MEIKTAFLNGNLMKDMYMIQLDGFVSKENSHKVFKLEKSIYELK